jgi:hypothetical protein
MPRHTLHFRQLQQLQHQPHHPKQLQPQSQQPQQKKFHAEAPLVSTGAKVQRRQTLCWLSVDPSPVEGDERRLNSANESVGKVAIIADRDGRLEQWLIRPGDMVLYG